MKLPFLSRHYPTEAQLEIARMLGFDGIDLKRVVFPDNYKDLKKMIDKLGILCKIVALSAPTWVHVCFWERGYETLEFVRSNTTREDVLLYNKFLCKGLWTFRPEGRVETKFLECPMSVEEQLNKLGLKGDSE